MSNHRHEAKYQALNPQAFDAYLRCGEKGPAMQASVAPELKAMPVLGDEGGGQGDGILATEWKSLYRLAFDHYLRSGRLVTIGEGLALCERKFNPYHDERGRFTYAPGGAGASKPSPLKPVKGYPEDGQNAWRKANDQIFKKAADDFNQRNGLKPGDPRYMDPQMMKDWAMVESGGNKNAFLTDPFQVNKPGDWFKEKYGIGLQPGEIITPEKSANAALRWLDMKGYVNTLLNDGTYSRHYNGLWHAFMRYNGNYKIDSNGKKHSINYADEIFSLFGI